MSKLSSRLLLLASLTLCSAAQQSAILHVRGHITDATTHLEVAGVSISAAEAKHPAITDANGFFSLDLREGVKPGDDVRIHIEKEGYRADDITEAASQSVTYPIKIAALKIHKATPLQPGSPKESREATKAPRLGTGPDAYKDIGDATVGGWAIEEADKIQDMAENAIPNILSRPTSSEFDLMAWDLSRNFQRCCSKDLGDLRSELLRRLGPPARSAEEERLWKPVSDTDDSTYLPLPTNLMRYLPYFRCLGLKLKRREVPRTRSGTAQSFRGTSPEVRPTPAISHINHHQCSAGHYLGIRCRPAHERCRRGVTRSRRRKHADWCRSVEWEKSHRPTLCRRQ